MLVDQLFTIPTSRRLDENTMSDQEILELFSTIDPFGARLANLKPTAATALGRAGGKLINYVGRKERDLRNKVTFSNIKKKWEQMGRVNDSEAVADFLAKQGVPQDKIDSAYSDLGISRTAAVPTATAPAATGGAGIQTGDIYAIDPETGNPYEKEKLAAKWATPTATPATSFAPATTNVTTNAPGFNYASAAAMSGIKPAATAPAKTTNFGVAPTGYKSTATKFNPPVTRAPSAPTAPKAPTSQKLTPAEYIKKIGAPALPESKQAVAETIAQVKKMLETVETRDDVNFIKKYIDQEFQRHGLVSEAYQARRSHLLHEVTRIGALRRRNHSQKLAK